MTQDVDDAEAWVAVAQGLADLRRILGRLRQRQKLIGVWTMAQNDDITSAEDALDALLGTLISAFAADNSTITDLKAQLAAGPPGLTADQGAAILARLVANQAKVSDALAAAAPAAPSRPSTRPRSASCASSGGCRAYWRPG